MPVTKGGNVDQGLGLPCGAGWRGAFLIGVVGGGLLFALLAGGFGSGGGYGWLSRTFDGALVGPILVVAGVLIGVAFGFLLSWGQATSPDEIREMLLLEDAYLYLMLGSGVVVATVGTRLLRRARARGPGLRLELLHPGRRARRRRAVPPLALALALRTGGYRDRGCRRAPRPTSSWPG
jgi:hypothetical protein